MRLKLSWACNIASLLMAFWALMVILKDKTDDANRSYNLVKIHEQRRVLTSRLDGLISSRDHKELLQGVRALRDEVADEALDITPLIHDTENCSSERVCNEVYLGNNADQPWHKKAWSIEVGCSEKVGFLLTVIILASIDTQQLVLDVREQDSSLPIIIGVPPSKKSMTRHWKLDNLVKIHFLDKEDVSQAWNELVSECSTEYVFLGHNLRRLPEFWGNFGRLVRLMDAKNAAAVTGATKNSTGHWRSHCWQTSISGHNLVLTPGYRQSTCDCMKCSLFWDSHGPFVARKSQLLSHLHPALGLQMMFVSFFLSMQSLGYDAFSCPDLMFLTADDPDPPSQSNWLQMARKWGLQGISIDLGPMKIYQFSCSTLELVCDPEDQTKSYIVPWCCHTAAFQVFKSMEVVAKKLGLHYELNSGSLLGAVKLHNFIPWDIDGDMYIPTEHMHHFHEGGLARELLQLEGITFHGWSEDNYWDKGAGHYQLRFQGLEFELMGKRGNLTLHKDQPPTRILYGDSWVRVHDHPGQYARGRYGPRYLQHSQSWKFLENMNGAFDSYGGHQWTHCANPGHHACLELYPSDGNVIFLPHRYP